MRTGVHNSVVLCIACVCGSVMFGIAADLFTRRTPLAFLFHRPSWARLPANELPITSHERLA